MPLARLFQPRRVRRPYGAVVRFLAGNHGSSAHKSADARLRTACTAARASATQRSGMLRDVFSTFVNRLSYKPGEIRRRRRRGIGFANGIRHAGSGASTAAQRSSRYRHFRLRQAIRPGTGPDRWLSAASSVRDRQQHPAADARVDAVVCQRGLLEWQQRVDGDGQCAIPGRAR